MPQRKLDNQSSPNGYRRGGLSRLLVVDDEESVRVTTAAILEQEGYEVATASDGREALEMTGHDHFGAATIITGVSAHVASDLVKLGVRLEEITTRRRLADGLRLALELVNQGSGAGDEESEKRLSLSPGSRSSTLFYV